VRYQNVFYRSDDAGRTWKKQELGIPLATLDGRLVGSIDQIDSLHAIAVGEGGLIISTQDAGNTWSIEECPVTSWLAQVSCASPDDGIIFTQDTARILVRRGNGWVVLPLRPMVDTLTLFHSGTTQLFCHSYGNGKYRVVALHQRPDTVVVDTTTLKYVKKYGWVPLWLYCTTDDWKTVDSSMIPFAGKSSKWDGYFTSFDYLKPETVFGGGDTIIVDGHNSAPNAGYGILSRTFDGGAHWQRFIDTSRYYGYSNTSPLSPRVLVSEVFDTQLSKHSLDDSPLIVTGDPVVLRSTDAGASWTLDSFLFRPQIDTGLLSITYFTTLTSDGSTIGVFNYTKLSDYTSGSFLARLDASPASVATVPSADALQCYPNPATDLLHVESEARVVSVFDPLGRAYEYPRHGNSLDISRLPAGVYYVSDGTHRARFVKE
jgi:hypothetical protein